MLRAKTKCRGSTNWLADECMVSDHLDLPPQGFKQNPLPHAEPLKQSESELGPYRFRIGDDSVDFDLNGQEIVVLRVRHRRELYKR
jgi:hypothetical protein